MRLCSIRRARRRVYRLIAYTIQFVPTDDHTSKTLHGTRPCDCRFTRLHADVARYAQL